MNETTTGWLIEHYDHNDGHRWLGIVYTGSINGIQRGELRWCSDAICGLLFARKQDAIYFALLHPEFCTLANITEHMFIK